jgi:hypothetical protein
VTEPNKGLKAADIESIVYSWETHYVGTNYTMSESIYLLLKDGTVHDGVPVAPADLDVATSRKQEPKAWGRWRREGDEYLIAWSGHPTSYQQVQGYALDPVRKGTKLAGRWETSSSSSYGMAGGSFSSRGVALTKDGHFEEFRSGGAYVGGTGTSQNTMATAAYDNDRSSAYGTGPNFAIGSTRKDRSKEDRTGTYEIDGYNLTLTYDNGTVVRSPFATNSKQTSIWVKGAFLRSEQPNPPRARKR